MPHGQHRMYRLTNMVRKHPVPFVPKSSSIDSLLALVFAVLLEQVERGGRNPHGAFP